MQKYDSSPFLKIPTKPLVKRNRQQAVKIMQMIHEAFNESELRELTMGLGVDYEDVEGGNKKETVQNIVAYYRRQRLLAIFVDQLRVERPNYDWPEVIIE